MQLIVYLSFSVGHSHMCCFCSLQQALNSDFSSQDVSNSSRSSPSLSQQLELSVCDADTKVSYTPDDHYSTVIF